LHFALFAQAHPEQQQCCAASELTLMPHIMSQSSHPVQGFTTVIKTHLPTRLQGFSSVGDETKYTPTELQLVEIKNNRIYEHSTCQILYTTYNKRQALDTVNPHSHADIVVRLALDDLEEPYLFGRVIGIYHANITFGNEPEPQQMDFLHVRWLSPPGNGQQAKHLPRVGFFDCSLASDAEEVFGFVDPQDVI
jgi:hypothetical protein